MTQDCSGTPHVLLPEQQTPWLLITTQWAGTLTWVWISRSASEQCLFGVSAYLLSLSLLTYKMGIKCHLKL